MKSSLDALLVEDNLSDAQLFRALIGSSGSLRPTLYHEQRFQGAIEALRQRAFDVILLDLCLPDGRGLDLVQQLKHCAPETPVIVITGLQDQNLALLALHQGVQDYLIKSEIFSPQRLTKLGYQETGNLLIERLRYAIERAELNRQLEITKERYALAVEGANDGIWDWDLVVDQIYYSPRCCSLLGLDNSQVSNHPNAWMSRIHANDREVFQQNLDDYLNHRQQQFYCEYRLLYRKECYRWILTRGVALWDDNDVPYRLAGSHTDVTSRKSLEQDLFREKELAQITLQSIGDAVITTDAHGYIKDFNPVAEKLTGWKARDAKNQPISKVCHIIDGNTRQNLQNPALQAIEEERIVSLSSHPSIISQTGEEFAIGDSAAPIRSETGRIMGSVLVFHDVTEERGRAQQLTWQASHDQLTKLFNRKKLVQALAEVIEASRGEKSHHILCYMDLDHFKAVNDACGHLAGDELLRQVADLWRSKVRQSDVLARLGGDEFGLLIYNCNLTRAIAIAKSFCDSIQSFRFSYNSRVFNLGVSIGIVPITSESIDVEEVLGLADTACYTAKNKGRNRIQVYHPNDDHIVQQSADVQWVSRINEALDFDQFQLYGQIIKGLTTEASKVELCEVLLRLSHASSQEVIPPMAFIPPAERYNLMPKIDRWVVKHTLEHLSANPCSADRIYSINLSGLSINDEDFVGFLKQQLSKCTVLPQSLCFEITETVAISNLQKAAAFILELKQLGCRFALDDFGSGMSSFSYLKQLPVDYLKIDGSLVKEAPTDQVTCAMVEAINQIGQMMGLQTIAEYVENINILDKAHQMGIDYAQGYVVDYPQLLMN